MDEIIFSIVSILRQEWLIQDLVGSSIFSLISYPLTKINILKLLKKRKKNRISEAQEELNREYIKRVVDKKYIGEDEFNNLLYILSSKYNLKNKDIFYDKQVFAKNITNIINESEFITENTKEILIDRIRKNEIFLSISDKEKVKKEKHKKEYQKSYIPDDESVKNDDDFNNDNITLDKEEIKFVNKYSCLMVFYIFLSFFLISTFMRLLISMYGINAVIFINIIIIIISILPILTNGIFNFKDFNERNKKIFYLLLVILVLNLINFICLISTFL